jgi:hypothetical protein
MNQLAEIEVAVSTNLSMGITLEKWNIRICRKINMWLEILWNKAIMPAKELAVEGAMWIIM